MKKIFGLILIVLVFGGVFNLALAEEKPVKLHYFYASTCPNCKKAGVFLDKLEFSLLKNDENIFFHTESDNSSLLKNIELNYSKNINLFV